MAKNTSKPFKAQKTGAVYLSENPDKCFLCLAARGETSRSHHIGIVYLNLSTAGKDFSEMNLEKFMDAWTEENRENADAVRQFSVCKTARKSTKVLCEFEVPELLEVKFPWEEYWIPWQETERRLLDSGTYQIRIENKEVVKDSYRIPVPDGGCVTVMSTIKSTYTDNNVNRPTVVIGIKVGYTVFTENGCQAVNAMVYHSHPPKEHRDIMARIIKKHNLKIPIPTE